MAVFTNQLLLVVDAIASPVSLLETRSRQIKGLPSLLLFCDGKQNIFLSAMLLSIAKSSPLQGMVPRLETNVAFQTHGVPTWVDIMGIEIAFLKVLTVTALT
jgi:hypothetical protein